MTPGPGDTDDPQYRRFYAVFYFTNNFVSQKKFQEAWIEKQFPEEWVPMYVLGR